MGLRRAHRIGAAALLALLAAPPALADPEVGMAWGEIYSLLAIPVLLFAIIAIEVLVIRRALRPPHVWRVVIAANVLSAVIGFAAVAASSFHHAWVVAYGIGYAVEIAIMVAAWRARGVVRAAGVTIAANVVSTAAFFLVLLPGWTAFERFVAWPRVSFTRAAHWVPAGLSYRERSGNTVCLDAVDAGHVWLLPGDATLRRSADGGRHWQRLLGNVDRVDFVTQDVGWAGRWGPRYNAPASLGRTTDGGRTWRWQEVGDPAIVALSAVDGEEAWAATRLDDPRPGATHLLHTGDGGRTWQSVPIPPVPSLRAMTFLDHRLGWLVPESWDASEDRAPLTVLRTSDGGRTFQTALTPKLAAGGESCTIRFVSPREGWITAGTPRLLHTRDGGATWEAVAPPTPEGVTPSRLLDCWFLNPKVGWAVGYVEFGNESHALALSTRDGGRTWRRLDTGAEKMTNAYLDRVLFLDEAHGWLCGGSFGKPTGDLPDLSHLTQFILRYRP